MTTCASIKCALEAVDCKIKSHIVLQLPQKTFQKIPKTMSSSNIFLDYNGEKSCPRKSNQIKPTITPFFYFMLALLLLHKKSRTKRIDFERSHNCS